MRRSLVALVDHLVKNDREVANKAHRVDADDL